MILKKHFFFTLLSFFVLLGSGGFAQTMSADDIKDAEQQGMTRYRVSGTYTEKVTASASAKGNPFNLNMIVGQAKMSINGTKTVSFNGIGFMGAVNNDSPDLCKYDMQIDGLITSWLSCSSSGSANEMRTQSETVTYTQKNMGSCTANSNSTNTLTSEGVENYAGVNFCFYNPNKWMIEIGTTFKNAKMITKGEEQRCEAGKVIKTPIDSETEYYTRIGFSTSPEQGGKITFDGKKFIISYTFTRTDKENFKGKETDEVPFDLITSGQGQIEITPIGGLEAFIEPVAGMADYKQWLPKGPDPEINGSTGNAAQFTVFLRDPRKPNQKIKAGIKQVKYSLAEVSHEPGYSMNFPSENPSKKADLQLNRDIEVPNPEIEKLELTISKTQDPDLKVVVQSFDYGAYGKLKAFVTLDNGTELNAQEVEIGQSFMPIPFRKNAESRIADTWKQDQKVTDLPDKDDEEKGEDGVGDHNGDGFSLYEEYRGFIENKKHIRLDPTKKDLLICNQIENKERSEDGIAMYHSVTKIVTHAKFRPEEFGKEELSAANLAIFAQYGIKPFKYNKVMNLNSSPETHLVDQHGMLLSPSPKSLGAAFAIQSAGNVGFSTLKNWLCLVIPADFDPSPTGYSQTRGDITQNGTDVKYDQNGKALIITDFYASRVAHEMLHYSNVKHHGDTDLWYGQYLSNGQVIIFQELTKEGAGVDRDQNGKADTLIVRLMFDSGNEIMPNDARWYKGGAWEKGISSGFVSRKGGQHSGFDDCIMRYDVAEIYEKTTATGIIHYLVKPPNPIFEKDPRRLFNQLAGIKLCTSGEGTGVNAFGFLPRPRTGNATVGNCKHQVCINDRYH